MWHVAFACVRQSTEDRLGTWFPKKIRKISFQIKSHFSLFPCLCRICALWNILSNFEWIYTDYVAKNACFFSKWFFTLFLMSVAITIPVQPLCRCPFTHTSALHERYNLISPNQTHNEKKKSDSKTRQVGLVITLGNYWINRSKKTNINRLHYVRVI